VRRSDILRLHLGYFTLPEDSPIAGQKAPVCAYLIMHPDGPVLFDTGIGEGHAEAERLYHPVRFSLDEALRGAGVHHDDVRVIANCHFHLDHCGGNPTFPGIPIFAQRAEHAAADSIEYTLPSLVEFDGARYELHEGEADVLPGLRIVPTPGHTQGHQSLVVRTAEGTVVLAGQAVNGASDYSRAVFARSLRLAGREPDAPVPEWLEELLELDPVEVLFAHDLAAIRANDLVDPIPG
jgi:glyoxylase-like metal-dependent hydrolase (beta-lactamase superfamily II)